MEIQDENTVLPAKSTLQAKKMNGGILLVEKHKYYLEEDNEINGEVTDGVNVLTTE